MQNFNWTPEEALTKGHIYLETLSSIINGLALKDGILKDEWLNELTRLNTRQMPSVTIAIYGATGSGKSSLLNAILEGDIAPTSGVQAATSLATEISWHSSADMQATITFLSENEWRAELAVLLEYFQDIDGNGLVDKDGTNVALAKVHAVYPKLTAKDFAHMTVDQIIGYDDNIVNLLNSEPLVITEQDSTIFSKKIQQYVKSAQKSKAENENNPDAIGYWPLVKQVSIRCNADVLSTGAVIVDLPGVADTNAARNRVAQDYLKCFDLMWIVTHVTRAADDKIAQDIVKSDFENQVKMDSKFDSITLIATKSDDVKATELVRDLQLENEVEVRDSLECIKNCIAATEVQEALKAELLKQKAELRRQRNQFHQQAEKSDAPDAPNSSTGDKRRLIETSLEQSSKRPRPSLENNGSRPDENDFSANNQSTSISEGSDGVSGESPSWQTLSVISDDVDDRIEEARKLIATLKEDRMHSQLVLNAFCSTRRSEIIKYRLKEEFLGLKALDVSQSSSNLTANIRDNESFDLPVFTVSSRDYIKLTRPATGDGEATCFSSVEDTEIPALKQWCHAQTLPFRKDAVTAFLTDIQILAVSISTFINDGNTTTMEDRNALRKRWESRRLRSSAARDGGVAGYLNKKLLNLVQKTVLQLQHRLRDGLEEDCAKGAALAAENALETLQKMISRMHWQTFRATLRRDGSWKDNINLELVSPLTITILNSWCSIFEADMFAEFQQAAMDIVDGLMKKIENSTSQGAKDYVKSQTAVSSKEAKVAFEATLKIVRKTMSQEQKSASRCYEPYVRDKLCDEAYRPALQEKGRGSVKRQQSVVEDAVEKNRDSLFADAADVLLETLEDAVDRIGSDLKVEMLRIGRKVEGTLSIIWSPPPTSEAQMKHLASIHNILKMIGLNLEAASESR